MSHFFLIGSVFAFPLILFSFGLGAVTYAIDVYGIFTHMNQTIQPTSTKIAGDQILKLAGNIAGFIRKNSRGYDQAKAALGMASTLLLENISNLWTQHD
ncbi:MAG TPA: hypothetical protein VJ464_03375 [Blastocatellia bacterium]|nr:hypothetical protein [Blastocatellia bacterium]